MNNINKNINIEDITNDIQTLVSNLADNSFENGMNVIINFLKQTANEKNCLYCENSILTYENDMVTFIDCKYLSNEPKLKEEFKFLLNDLIFPEEDLPLKYNCFELSLEKLVDDIEYRKTNGEF